MHNSIVQSDNWNCQTNTLLLNTHSERHTCTSIQTDIQYKYTQTHTQADAGPSGKRQCSTALYFGLLGLLGDVSMVTVMSDLQTCALPSIWLRLANQITSTHTQMHCQISSRVRKFFGGVTFRSLPHFTVILISSLLSVTVITEIFVQLAHDSCAWFSDYYFALFSFACWQTCYGSNKMKSSLWAASVCRGGGLDWIN